VCVWYLVQKLAHIFEEIGAIEIAIVIDVEVYHEIRGGTKLDNAL